jgi:hypothetical protein
MTAEQLVAEARRLLDETPAGTTSAWPRAAALLCRQALEDTLDELWVARAPSLRFASMRAQLSCLPSYLSPAALAHDVAFSWHALSHATHHHPYELDPVREELDPLITTTRKLIVSVAVQARLRPAGGAPSR